MRMYSSGVPVNLFVASTHASGRPRAQRSQITNAVVKRPAIPPTNLIASSIVVASPGCAEFHAAPPIQTQELSAARHLARSLWRWWRMRSNDATPLSSQATASPSIMQERERKRANVSTICGKRRVKFIAGPAVEPSGGDLALVVKGSLAADRREHDGACIFQPEDLGRHVDLADVDQPARTKLEFQEALAIGAQRDLVVDAGGHVAEMRGWNVLAADQFEIEDVDRVLGRLDEIVRAHGRPHQRIGKLGAGHESFAGKSFQCARGP